MTLFTKGQFLAIPCPPLFFLTPLPCVIYEKVKTY